MSKLIKWKPFTTAPKDGTKVLVFGAGFHDEIAAAYFRQAVGRTWHQVNETTQKLVDRPIAEWCFADSATPLRMMPSHWAPYVDLSP
jgi:hypothetical protein